MTTPIDDDRVGTVMREMLSATDAHRPPVDPSELRSRARRTALRRLDRKVLVAVAAVAAVIVTLIAVGPLRSGTPPTHSPATQPTSTTTAPTTTTTPTTTTAPTTTTTAVPVAVAAAQLDTYVADEAAADSTAAAANGVTGHYGIPPLISVHSAPVADDGQTVAVAAFSYDPNGHPVQVLSYSAGHWTLLAGLAAPTGNGVNPGTVVFLTAGPVAVADVTGDGRPDFLIMSSAADNVPGFVVSQAGGTWRYIPFLGPNAPSPTDVLARSPQFEGNSLVSDYNDCVPDCAGGHNSTIYWTYQPSAGEFTAPDPPGYISPTTAPGGS
jgi:hypothetical protein